MISEEGVRATPRIKEAIRAGINTFDKNAEDESGSEAVMNAFIPLSYSPPAEADTGKMTSTNLATKAPRNERTKVVTIAHSIVVLNTLPPNLFFLRLAVPLANVIIDVPRNRNAATPVR